MDVADEDVKDAFFEQLHQVVGQTPPHDITIILTNANVTLSSSDRCPGSPVGTTFFDRSTNAMETGFFFSATLTTSVLLTPGFSGNRSSTTTQGTAQTAELGRHWTISSSLDAGGCLLPIAGCTEDQVWQHGPSAGAQLRLKLRATSSTSSAI